MNGELVFGDNWFISDSYHQTLARTLSMIIDITLLVNNTQLIKIKFNAAKKGKKQNAA